MSGVEDEIYVVEDVEQDNIPDVLKSGPAGKLWTGRVVPLLMPSDAKSTTRILTNIMTCYNTGADVVSVEDDDDEGNGEEDVADDSATIRISYDVFMPKFKKGGGKGSPPDYRVVVCTPSIETDAGGLPSYETVVRVTSKCKDKVPVLFAVSKHGSLSFYCFSAVGLPTQISFG